MKIKSSYGKGVCFEYWNTPVMQSNQLWLSAVLQTMSSIHLFLRVDSDKAKDIHVLTISRLWPFRMTEEQYAYTCVGKYLRRKTTNKKYNKSSSTFKIWNTSFIEDIEENKALSDYAKKRDKNIFEYLIVTQDEWIEFISLSPPEWALHKNIKIDKLVMQYLKKSMNNKEHIRKPV